MFKYMTFSDRVRFLFRMFQRSYKDILVFTLVIIVFVFAFGMMGYLSFSQDVSDFRTFGHSVANLGRYIIGDLDYAVLVESNRSLGSAFYFMWGVLILLILANVFIAILSDSYATVAEDFVEEEDIFAKLGFVKRTKSMLKSVVKASRKLSVRDALRKTDLTGDLDNKFEDSNAKVCLFVCVCVVCSLFFFSWLCKLMSDM